MRLYLVTIGLILTFSFSAFSAATIETSIVVSSESTVDAKQVYLGDVAKISGPVPVKTRLAKLSLGLSPKVGSFRVITLRKVRLVIAAAGFSLDKIRITMPERAFVKRKGVQIDLAELEARAKDEIKEAFGTGVELRVSDLEVPDPGLLPSGTVDFDFNFKGIRNPFAPFSLPIKIKVDGRLVRTLSIRVDLEAFAEVFVATREIPQNKRITDAMVEKRRIRILQPVTNFITKDIELKGIASSRMLREGDPIGQKTVVKAIVIRNGDDVTIEAVSERFTLNVAGVALGPGRIGERIAVKNKESGRVFKAKIVDEGIVRVRF